MNSTLPIAPPWSSLRLIRHDFYGSGLYKHREVDSVAFVELADGRVVFVQELDIAGDYVVRALEDLVRFSWPHLDRQP